MDQRAIPEECAIALVYDGTTAAVVMATPADLTDLAIGFSVTEGIIETASEIEDLNVVTGVDGVELRMWLKPGCGAKFKVRQRRLVGLPDAAFVGLRASTKP